MNRALLSIVSAVVATSACSFGNRIVDGGMVDRDGWPVRPADRQLRCPDDTYLHDDIAKSGRRTVLCRKFASHNPRAFELTWNDAGVLVSEMQLSETGVPVKRLQWFDDGKKSVEELYEEGRLIRKLAYYSNGRVRANIAYDPTREVTIVQRFGPDGSVEEEGEMRDGRLVGEWKEWKDGALETLVYVDGVPQGEVDRAYPAGGKERGRYEGGRRAGKWIRYDDRDNPMREVEYANGKKHGVFRLYHPNGQLREEGAYLDDQKNGRWQTWHPSGELATDAYFACGRQTGPYKTYSREGTPEVDGWYEDNRRVGEWKKFTPNGVATEIEQNPPPSEPFDPAKLPQSCESTEL